MTPKLIGTVLAFCVFAPPAVAVSSANLRLEVSVSEQKMRVFLDEKKIKEYPVSSSKYGIGSRLSSYQTPLGRHRVARKIGAGAPFGTVFKNRINTSHIAAIDRSSRGSGEDLVTSRILWLEGLEKGKNRGGRVDSFRRFIYIHGTNNEGLIGQPASNGCIRMRNRDVIELFEGVPEGTPVDIRP